MAAPDSSAPDLSSFCYRDLSWSMLSSGHQNDICNKKTAQGHDWFNKLNEPSEEEPRDFDKTSNTIIDIQTPTLQKSLSCENLGTPQDIRNIRVQFPVLKRHVMCELSSLNEKISK